MKGRLRIPSQWAEFEFICHKLWRDIWSDSNAQMNGRSGSAQHGVDIFGCPIYQDGYAGVQCKDKDGRFGSVLKTKELGLECDKAANFFPKLKTFSIATTSSRNASIQNTACNLSQSGKYPFSINVWSWDDIEEELLYRPTILRHYYPNCQFDMLTEPKLHLSQFSSRDQFWAFFSRPIILERVASRLRDFLVPLAYEMSDNAFAHGKATDFRIECTEKDIVFEDNGVPFNPVTQLDATKTSKSSHIGSFVFDSFRKAFSTSCSLNYSRHSKRNRLTFAFNNRLHELGSSKAVNVFIDMTHAYSRGGAEQLALSIAVPRGISDLVLVVADVHNISAFVEVVDVMLRRLPSTVSLTISLPRTELLQSAPTLFGKWFNDSRLKVLLR